MRSKTLQGLSGVLVAAVLATACGQMANGGNPAGPTGLGADGGRVGLLGEIGPGPGTGAAPGTPAGPGLGAPNTCSDTKPVLTPNVKDGVIHLETTTVNLATGYSWEGRRTNGNAAPVALITPRTFSSQADKGAYNQTPRAMPPATYQFRVQTYFATCAPQHRGQSDWVTVTVNGPGDNPEQVVSVLPPNHSGPGGGHEWFD